MEKIIFKNILNHYIPQNYLDGTPGKPITWTSNIKLAMFDIPMTMIWIITLFFSHGIYHKLFGIYVLVWGISALISSSIIAVILTGHDEEKMNRWTSPITFLMMVGFCFNINLSMTCLDDRVDIIGIRVITYAICGFLFCVLIHAIVHFFIAIISTYKGRKVGEKLSTYYIVLMAMVATLMLMKGSNYYFIIAGNILLSIISFLEFFQINSVYLTFHPEQRERQQREIHPEKFQEGDGGKGSESKQKEKKGKQTLKQSKKYLK